MCEIERGWLIFKHRFNEPLSNIVFPVDIQKIHFDNYFNQNVSQLPKSITNLRFYNLTSDKFNKLIIPYLYHLIKFIIHDKYKNRIIMNKRCKINHHNGSIRDDKLIDLLLKKNEYLIYIIIFML